MEIRELQSLIILEETGSITQTAEKLYVSAPAIHKRLKSLEETLDVQLYEKAGRQIRLTEAAKGLLPHAKTLLAQRDAIHSYLEGWKGSERSILRIGAGSTFSSYLLPPLIEAFRQRFSEVEVFVDTGKTPAMLNDLSKGALDLVFAVSSALLKKPSYVVEANWDFDVVMVGSSGQFTSATRAVNLEEKPFILFKKEGGVFYGIVERYFARADFEPYIAMVFDNLETTKAMTSAGLGLSMLPEWTVKSELESGALVMIPKPELPLLLRVALVTREMSYLPQAVKTFVRLAKKWNWRSKAMD